jgi:hypothetical protein
MSRFLLFREPDLEREMFRKSVDALVADRHCCSDCGRTPLIGETIYQYERGEVVCELCRMLRPGTPLRVRRVHHSEHGQTVKVTSRVAA